MCRLSLVIVLALVAQPEAAHVTANPIRKVVTMLQAMSKKVEAEGAKEKNLYDAFMCYCKSGGGSLQAGIDAAETKIPRLEADIQEAVSQKSQTGGALAKAQSDRDAAKDAMADATTIRDKEAAAFASEKSDDDANIAAIAKAVAALEKGAGGSFLQTSTAQVVHQLAIKLDMADEDRQQMLSFLSGATEYAPQSGQITGILKTMGDEMNKGLAEATAAENSAIQTYDGLMGAKKKEVSALQASIESKMTQSGDSGVHIEQMKNDLQDTKEGLAEDEKFLANMGRQCASKTALYEDNVKIRNEELQALAETIKVLNDDDALELFKKTLPGAGSSLVQQAVSATSMRAQALALIKATHSPSLDFIALALHGKKIGFAKVIGMIDAMVVTLKKEQEDDNSKKEYCSVQFDQSDDKKKALERSVSDEKDSIMVANADIATLTEEIAALNAAIRALDKSVADATTQRKEENTEYKDLVASDSAAKEVLAWAKNRLNKFYNPTMYKPPAKRELSEEERVMVSIGGTAPPTAAPGGIAGTGISFAQVSMRKGAPAPPPASFGGYNTRSSENTGVIAMIDILIKDLDKELQTAEVEEKDAQSDYEQAMKDSAEKRTEDSKTLTDKESAKAATEKELEEHKETKASETKNLAATLQYIASLHAECDWLLEYFDVRNEARTGEIDALGKAKAVLSGADYSLVQTHIRVKAYTFLGRS